MESGSDHKELMERDDYHLLLEFLYQRSVPYRSMDLYMEIKNKIDWVPAEDKITIEKYMTLRGYGYVEIQTVGHLNISVYNIYLTRFGQEMMRMYRDLKRL